MTTTISAPESGSAPTTGSPGEFFVARMSSPLGRIEVTSDGEAVTALAIESGGALPHDGVDDIPCAVLDSAIAQLTEYFAGERTTFDVPVALEGTPFRRAVWERLQAIPFGEVESYGSIGRATGRPTAGRAVGGAIGANPVPIIVGCHRVLATNKKITGYSAGDGVPTKVWLLDHEGIAHR
ncbi:methylated-DNA--[protein]-cysteine S-methyltransferase [Marisediminicola sp. LYQ85]|uniref:methylated-DNA--[protein]-cysteine S-methyltransferase n=1 Tax=Marisediminicola sp. LYQ85 TaxID=3391062 RepID=UPI0039833304